MFHTQIITKVEVTSYKVASLWSAFPQDNHEIEIQDKDLSLTRNHKIEVILSNYQNKETDK